MASHLLLIEIGKMPFWILHGLELLEPLKKYFASRDDKRKRSNDQRFM